MRFPYSSMIGHIKIGANVVNPRRCRSIVEWEVGEGGAKLADEPFDVLGATLEHRSIGLVGEVADEDLVRKLQVPLVGDLFDVTPEDCLVLFCGHAAPGA